MYPYLGLYLSFNQPQYLENSCFRAIAGKGRWRMRFFLETFHVA